MKISFWKQESPKHYSINFGNGITGHITVMKNKRFHPYVIWNKTQLEEDWKDFFLLGEAKRHCYKLKQKFSNEIVLFF